MMQNHFLCGIHVIHVFQKTVSEICYFGLIVYVWSHKSWNCVRLFCQLHQSCIVHVPLIAKRSVIFQIKSLRWFWPLILRWLLGALWNRVYTLFKYLSIFWRGWWNQLLSQVVTFLTRLDSNTIYWGFCSDSQWAFNLKKRLLQNIYSYIKKSIVRCNDFKRILWELDSNS